MPRQPNGRLAEVMRRTRCSNTSLAARVRGVAQEHGADLKCTHVDVRRWLDGVAPRPATAQFIATALSRKAGTRLSPDDIGMGSAADSAIIESGLDYPADGSIAGQRLLGLTRRELAEDIAALGASVVQQRGLHRCWAGCCHAQSRFRWGRKRELVLVIRTSRRSERPHSCS